MTFSYRRLFLHGNTFCCCLPVRLGVISMSILGVLVAGLLTVLLWYEVSSTGDLTGSEKAAFILAALMETALFAASLFGIVGAVVRKQSFIQIYAYILYGHFVLNLGVAAYLLYEIFRVTHNAEDLACQTAIKDPQAQGQCEGLLAIARWIYVVVASIVLLVELYGVVIVTRYLNQLKREKGLARAIRQDTEGAFSLKEARGHYSRLPPSPAFMAPLHPSYLGPSDSEFDPYSDPVRPAPSIEGGYGGGSWTHQDIASEEKARLQKQESENATVARANVGERGPEVTGEFSRKPSFLPVYTPEGGREENVVGL